MKKNIKITALLLVAVMLCGLVTACGEDAPSTSASLSATAEYTVRVVDPLGNPITGVAAKFMKNGEQAGMAMADAQGIASKELDRDTYTVALSFTDVQHSYYYDEAAAVLPPTETELEIVVAYAMSKDAGELYVGETAYPAYDVEAGCTYVNLAAAGRNYFIFTPSAAGVYEFSVQGAQATVGYYGTPYYIYENSAATVENGKFTITVEQSMIGTNGTGTTQLVIGVDSDTADVNCYLCIDRIADPPAVVDWEVYASTYTPLKYTLPAGLTIREFDLTADTYTLVFNEADQFYHLGTADGPVVLVRLLSENPYTGFAFGNILMGSNIGTYHYDENGQLVRKILYNDCIQPYLGQITGTGENQKFTGGMCDDTYGVYPLTRDLETIIKNYGEFKGYWDSTSSSFALAGVAGLNAENAWLFLCCYAE